MTPVQFSMHVRTLRGNLSVDIHHNETLLTLSGDSQIERINLMEVRS